MALLALWLAGVEVTNGMFDGWIEGGEASGSPDLYAAPLWDWAIWQETA
jgi:hypothetical protein